MMASTALAIDIVLPAMLIIGLALGMADPNSAQWIITAYVVPYAAGQLLFGPLSDRYGRRFSMLLGMMIYALGSFATVFATGFTMLLIARGLAGFGAASSRVATIATVRDCYSGRNMASVMSIIMMVFMLVPLIAPLLGQILNDLVGWQAIFAFMGLFGLSLFAWVALRLPETLQEENRQPLTYIGVSGAFRTVISNKPSLCYALATAIFFGSLFGFINSAPQIYLGIYDTGAWFPIAFSLGAAFIAFASLLNSRLVQRLGMSRLSHIALMVFITIAALLAAAAWTFEGVNVFVFTIGISMMLFCFGFIGTNFNALAMEPLGAQAGMASAVFGFLQMGIAGVVGAAIGQMFDGTIIPLMSGYIICGFISLGFVLLAESGKLFGVGEEYR